MKLVKSFWKLLDGRKTTIGVLVHFVGYGLKGIGAVDQSVLDMFVMAGDAVMAGGLSHKALKLFKK